MTAHTPGPWIVSSDGRLPIRITADADGRWKDWVTELAQIGGNVLAGPGDFEESHANAILMANAPNMLKALQAISDCWLCDVGDRRMQEIARAAIAKATGEA